MLMPSTWFKVDRIASLSLLSFRHLSARLRSRLISYINMYIFLQVANISQCFLSSLTACWSFRFWTWNMTFLDTEMKELGRSTQYNTHNTKVFICTLKYVPDIVADGRSLYGFTIHTHTHAHTHTHTHTNTHTHTHTHT